MLVGFTQEAEVKSKAKMNEGKMPTWLDEFRMHLDAMHYVPRGAGASASAAAGDALLAGGPVGLSFGLSEES